MRLRKLFYELQAQYRFNILNFIFEIFVTAPSLV
jgi:hypothetical protein